MIYGYARVSTKGQAKDGNGLDAQEKILKENGAVIVYYDAFTGTKVDRPELNKLVGMLKEGDTLIVSKLDRLGRSLSKTSELITELIDRGVKINILNLGILSNDSVNTLMRNVLLSFAQFERDMIVERTTEGKEICRETKPDWREGRKQVETPDFEKFLKKQKDGELTVAECCKELGISRSTWYNRARYTRVG
jgi:DNA invertase Pin-like site-specific DNA recombinase